MKYFFSNFFCCASIFISFSCKAQDTIPRPDTLVMTMSQYQWLDSNNFFFAYGMSYGNGLDTVIDFGDSLCFPRDIKGWKHDYILKWQDKWVVGKVYYPNGNLYKIYTNGGEGYLYDYLEYYENGELKIKGYYCDMCPGVKSGVWNYYDENGTLIKSEISKRKKCNRGEICN